MPGLRVLTLNGPTLEIAACELAFAEPIAGAWASDHIGELAAPTV